jgi:hypothetical protein
MQALMYLCNLETMRDHGHLATEAPFFLAWHGPECVGVTERWYADTLANAAGRRRRPLVRRMRRWLIQESKRRAWVKRRGKTNMPGGWDLRDAMAWYAASMRASWVLPIGVRLHVEELE